MRRDLTRPVIAAPLPSGVVRVPFTEAIAPACRALMNQCYADGSGTVIPYERWWPWLIGDADYHPDYVQVATFGGEVVGVCHGWVGNFIKDLAVDLKYRRKGLGTALITRALEQYAADGHTSVDLKTNTDNFNAQSLYQRLGFEIVERIES